MKWLLGLLLGLHAVAFAQPLTTNTPYDLTSTLGAPISVPVRFDLTGRVSFKFSADAATSFPLQFHGAWEWQRYEFIPAVYGMNEDWVEAPSDLVRLQVKRHRVEGGAGVGSAVKLLSDTLGLSVALVPYKGASFETRAFKKPTRGWYSLPHERTDWDEWSVGEGRDYQVYGGITFSVGAAFYGVSLAQAQATKQSRWFLSLDKVSDQYMRLRIRMDNWKKVGTTIGPIVASWEAALLKYFDHERSYLVDMHNPEAYAAVLALFKGRLDELQTASAVQEEESERMWQGTYHARYLGIPFIYGQSTARVRLEGFEIAGSERQLGILNIQVTNKGVLREVDPQVWTVVHDVQDEMIYFLGLSQSLEKGSLGVKERFGRWMRDVGLNMQWPNVGKKDFLDARLMFALSVERWQRWSETAVEASQYQAACKLVKLTCQKLSKAKKAIKRWNEVRNSESKHRMMQTAEFIVRHPLMWNLLLKLNGETLTVEFMAHGARWMPVQRVLTTETSPLN